MGVTLLLGYLSLHPYTRCPKKPKMRLLSKFYLPTLAVVGSFVTAAPAEDQCRCVSYFTHDMAAL